MKYMTNINNDMGLLKHCQPVEECLQQGEYLFGKDVPGEDSDLAQRCIIIGEAYVRSLAVNHGNTVMKASYPRQNIC